VAVKAVKLGPMISSKTLSVEKVSWPLQRLLFQNWNRRTRLRQEVRKNMKSWATLRIQQLKEQIRLWPTNGWVLINGENGTGKELVDRGIMPLA